MPRTARKRSTTGIYHTIVRGINRQTIFYDQQDYQKYLNTLARVAKETDAIFMGYCLMNNHVHMLIGERKEAISKVMKRIGTSYASWYNWKYERTGHVFQDRFRSENVEDDSYLLAVIRYIHMNPVKAALINRVEDYPWSSCSIYYGEKKPLNNLIQTSFVLGLFSEQESEAILAFRNFMKEGNEDNCLEVSERARLSDVEAVKTMVRVSRGQSINSLSIMNKVERDSILRQFKNIEGLSLRQIARLTGLGYQIINRA